MFARLENHWLFFVRSPRKPLALLYSLASKTTAHAADRALTPVVSLLPSRRTLASKPDCSTPYSQFFSPCLFGARPFTNPQTPPLSFTASFWPLPFSALGGVSPGERKEEGALDPPPLHKQITACDTSRHTCNVKLPNNLAKHAFNGGSGLILYLVAYEGPFP